MSIFKWFKKKEKQETPIDIAASLSFVLTQDGDLLIDCVSRSDIDEDTSTLFGIMLYKLNNGGLKSLVFNALKKEADDSFIRDILMVWAAAEEEVDNTPIVAPQNVFRIPDQE
jgi:hypothetical protein